MADGDALERLRSLGWCNDALDRLLLLAEGRFDAPADIPRVLDNFPYEHDWAADYQIRSAQASLMRPQIMCINAAILSYALLDAFAQVERRLLALHRRGPDGMECGHVVTAYGSQGGRMGAFSKSNYAVLDHRPPRFPTLEALAVSYAEAYVSIGFTPLYFGSPPIEDLGPGWRFGEAPLTDRLACFTQSYEYAFDLGHTPMGAAS